MKNVCLIFLTCSTMAFDGCATDEGSSAGEGAKAQETVPGETNPDAPDASQQTKPGFRF